MRAATRVLTNSAVAVAIVALTPVSAAEAKTARSSGKLHAQVSARADKHPASRYAAKLERGRHEHWSRYGNREAGERSRVTGPVLNLPTRGPLAGSNYYPPYGYPFYNHTPPGRRPTIGFYNSPYVQYSTSPFTGYYGWYGGLSP
jgi:hypothetical protein